MRRPVSPGERTGTKNKISLRRPGTMKLAGSVAECRDQLEGHRRAGRKIGLIPTMGFLHEGHLSLFRAARYECDIVVASLFVNPTQFRQDEDLDSYPRDFERDRGLAERYGVDVLFCPDPSEMYNSDFRSSVTVSDLSERLCGSPDRRGPEHFHGVTTVVAKLFNVVQPGVAYFGQKDAQQAAVIRQMVADLNFPVELRVLATVRESDGLAMSSRNSYLNDQQRRQATSIYRSLEIAVKLIEAGERDAGKVKKTAVAELERAGIKPEYFELVDPKSLTESKNLEQEVLIAVAATVGQARLIDNKLINVPDRERNNSSAGKRRNRVASTGAA